MCACVFVRVVRAFVRSCVWCARALVRLCVCFVRVRSCVLCVRVCVRACAQTSISDANPACSVRVCGVHLCCVCFVRALVRVSLLASAYVRAHTIIRVCARVHAHTMFEGFPCGVLT